MTKSYIEIKKESLSDAKKNFKYDLIEEVECGRSCTPKYRKKLLFKVSFAAFQLILLFFFLIFICFPLTYKFCYSLQRAAVFLNFKNIPLNPDYHHPAKYGLEGTRNYYVTTDDDVKLGVWQLLPEQEVGNYENSSFDDEQFQNLLSDGKNVIIYNHGNGGCRLTDHRIQLYKVLRQQFHVIAYDYRNYGDSSDRELSEDNVVQDIMYMIKWVKSKAKGHVFVWGHSLGTSLSTQALARLQTSGTRVTGLILESPFNNMREEISEFPLTRWFKHLPWFAFTVVDPMQENNFLFKTDVHICHVDLPIIILHAEDDNVVPYRLGYKLYEAALKCKSEKDGSIQFKSFEENLHYGHKYIYKDERLPNIISNFVLEAIKETRKKSKN